MAPPLQSTRGLRGLGLNAGSCSSTVVCESVAWSLEWNTRDAGGRLAGWGGWRRQAVVANTEQVELVVGDSPTKPMIIYRPGV